MPPNQLFSVHFIIHITIKQRRILSYVLSFYPKELLSEFGKELEWYRLRLRMQMATKSRGEKDKRAV